jgi:hypothetical protein
LHNCIKSTLKYIARIFGTLLKLGEGVIVILALTLLLGIKRGIFKVMAIAGPVALGVLLRATLGTKIMQHLKNTTIK